MILAVQNAQVERQQQGYDSDKADPHPSGLAQPFGQQKIHVYLHKCREAADIAIGRIARGARIAASYG
jgi:hypothetical protein